MKTIILISTISILSLNNIVSGQWYNLGVQGTEVLMIEDSKGYKFKNTQGPSPATGYTYEIESTENDWEYDEAIFSGGGWDYGCCVISNLDFIDISTGIISSKYQSFDRFMKTIDNGISWTPFSSAIMTGFNQKELVMVNDTNGYVTGNFSYLSQGRFYKLTPTESIKIFDWDTLYFTNANIDFPNSNIGFVVMKDTNQVSHLLKTDDSGVAWDIIFSSMTNDLTTISFPDSLTGYVCSANGEMHKTTDGGINWVQIVSPTTKKLNSVDFINDSVGYIACNSGEIYRTIDGASTWNSESSGITSNLIKVQMVDVNTAYCISEDGSLLKNGHVLATELSSSSMIIYPNPTSAFISIFLPNDEIIENAKLYDTNGKLVLTDDFNKIDVSSLNSGVYIIKAHSSENSYTSKFVKN